MRFMEGNRHSKAHGKFQPHLDSTHDPISNKPIDRPHQTIGDKRDIIATDRSTLEKMRFENPDAGNMFGRCVTGTDDQRFGSYSTARIDGSKPNMINHGHSHAFNTYRGTHPYDQRTERRSQSVPRLPTPFGTTENFTVL
jgi:hypothetical protein